MPRLHRFTILVAFAAAAAQANPMSDVAGGTTSFYSQTLSTYAVAGVDQEFTHNRIALDYSEKGNDWFYGGLTVGFVFLDAETEPLITDDSVPGYVFGIFGGVRTEFLDDRLAINAEGRYTREWESGNAGSGTDTTSIRFGEGSLRLGLSYRFDTVQFSVGGFTSNVVGEITREGLVSGNADFQDTESSGVYGGCDIKLYGGYALGLRVESGARETIALTFSSGLWRPQ